MRPVRLSLSFLNMVIPCSYHVFSEVTVQNDPVLGVFEENIFAHVEAAQMARLGNCTELTTRLHSI